MFSNLIFDKSLQEFFQFANRNFIISQIICSGDIGNHLKDEGNYLAVVPGEYDTISFLPKSKIDKVEDPWTQCRVKIKIGRFIKKFFSEFSITNWKIDDSEIEKFVNTYKSYFSSDSSNLKIIESGDISKYYLQDNYYSYNGSTYGTLWNSCMRQSDRNKFMKLYDINPNIKLLVLLSDDDKVKARALLWESGLVDKNGKEWKVMDRIYTYFDHDVDVFKKWADENGYIYKWEQNAKSELYFNVDGKKKTLRLKVNLNCEGLDYFPYLDTFKYYNVDDSQFSNNDRYDYDYILVSSRGYLPELDIDTDGDFLWSDTDINEIIRNPGSLYDRLSINSRIYRGDILSQPPEETNNSTELPF